MAAEPNDWQLQCKELKQRGAHLWQSSQWSDCSFLVGSDQEVVPAHKLILAIASPIFETMFYGNTVETNPIPIVDIQPEAFKALLQYIYTDNINISSVENACEIYIAAKTYGLPFLMKKCVRYLWVSLCPKNACFIYKFAKTIEPRWLLEKCIQIIQSQTKEVLAEVSFEKADLGTVQAMFSMENLNVDSELQLLEAAERRARALGPLPADSTESTAVRDMVSQLRLLTLSAEQFAEGPALSPLLARDDAFAVLMNIASSRAPVPLPSGFSGRRKPRNKRVDQPDNILEYLNEDVWSAVLDYVPVRDIIRSERVSRQWRKMVHSYLSGIRIGIEHDGFYSLKSVRNVRWVTLKACSKGKGKGGSCPLGKRSTLHATLVAAPCHTDLGLKAIQECPALEAVTFINLPEQLLLDQSKGFNRLKQICFNNCTVSDDSVTEFLTNNDLTKLEIRDNPQITGQCLTKTNLQSLTIDNCKSFQFVHLHTDHFKELVELELNGISEEIYTKLHLAIPNMPNLEVLVTFDNVKRCDKFFEAVCKLSKLECLYSCFEAKDEDLEALTMNCKNLRVLNLGNCFDVTGRGVNAAGVYAGPRLEQLGVVGSEYVTDDDVVTAVRMCPKLKWLDVCYCVRLTRALLTRAAAVRRELRALCPLHLYVTGTAVRVHPVSVEQWVHSGWTCVREAGARAADASRGRAPGAARTLPAASLRHGHRGARAPGEC